MARGSVRGRAVRTQTGEGSQEPSQQPATQFTRAVTVIARRVDQLVAFPAKAKPAERGTVVFRADILNGQGEASPYEAAAAERFVLDHPVDHLTAQAVCELAARHNVYPPNCPDLTTEETLQGNQALGPVVSPAVWACKALLRVVAVRRSKHVQNLAPG